MARRKKRRDAPTPGSKPKQDDGFGTFADLLGRTVPKDETPPKPERREAEPPPKPPPPTPARRLTPEELMAEAFEAAGGADTYSAKYRGQGFDAGDVEVAAPGDDQAIPVDERADLDPDALMFEAALGGAIQPMQDRDRYAMLDDHEWVGLSWRDARELATLSAEELMEPELTAAQRRLLKQSRGEHVAVLNIRGNTKAEAMGEVEAFVRAQCADGASWARVITGKGKQSAGAPVLKPAVIAWCEGEGAVLVRAWAPETDRSGNYGSVLLALRPVRP